MRIANRWFSRGRFCMALLLCIGLTAYSDVIVDNDDSGTSFTGTWSTSGGTDPYDGDSLWARNGATYTWGFDSEPAGIYEVLMWWSAWPSRATDIDVRIDYTSGFEDISINQQNDAGQWNSIGEYYFDGSGSVTITAASGSTVSTCADAVWFRLVSSNVPPSAYITSIAPNPAVIGELVEFSGYGEDSDGDIAAYSWQSSIDDSLSDADSFSTNSLSEGVHQITFEVQDDTGQWSQAALEVLIVGDAPVETIVDNLDDDTSRTGSWQVSGGLDPYDADSFWSRAGATFTWYFTPPQSGDYEVSMWWTEWPSRSTSAPIDIENASGTDRVYANQQNNGGQWNSQGTYTFSAGVEGSVTITAEDTSPTSYCADAVKFTLVPAANQRPTATIDSIAPNPPDVGQMVAFVGHGEDSDGSIVGYDWQSSIDGNLSDATSFSTDGLSEGEHVISFRVQDNEDLWSEMSTVSLIVGKATPTAIIDSIIPSPAFVDDVVAFVGHGEDTDGTISAYSWQSSIDGNLSDADSFSTSELSAGEHVISFIVYDDRDGESIPATQSVSVNVITTETIIDNGDPATSSVGSWQQSGGLEPYNANSLWSRNGTTYIWTFTPPVTGYYELSMCWTEWPSRTTNAQVSIPNADGTDTVFINQRQNGGQWNRIGEYYFNAGTGYGITITSTSGSASTCADAVKFVKVEEPGLLVVDFNANRIRGGAPFGIQFNNQSAGNINQWAWDFGDGQTSSQRSPFHTYTTPGVHTVSLTGTGPSGADTKTRYSYVDIKPSTTENIYLVDGYGGNNFFMPDIRNMLRGLNAYESGGRWVYQPNNSNMTYYMYTVHDPTALEECLKEADAHVVIAGHANFGFGSTFASSSEILNQRIDNIYYVDDDRFTNYSTDMVSTKVDGMKYGQAYPNWEPVFKDGSTALMPYDFGSPRGNPPYNYYLTYQIPGDPTVYKIELADGSYLERFPDASTPVWFSEDGSPPDPVADPEYFIRNTDADYNRCNFVGDWPIKKEPGGGYSGALGYLGYNYQVRWPGAGSNKAIWTFAVKYPGLYAVMGSWYPDPSNASNARYTIVREGGTSVAYADQRQTLLINPLGAYFFGQDSYTVTLDDNANGQVVADAMVLNPLDNPEEILQAEFTANETSGPVGLSVQFDDLSAYFNLGDPFGSISEWHWDFGDGFNSDAANPQHVYSAPGVYTVSLTVTDNSDDTASEVKDSFISVGAPAPLEAEFTSLNRLGSDRTVVNFIDQSSGNINDWYWDFGDGQTSTEQNPVHVYTEPDVYTVTLTVSGPDGDNTEVEEDFVYNIIGLIYADNTSQTKPHFYSRSTGSPITFGKVICYTGEVKVLEEDLGYNRMCHSACNSFQYFTGTFHRGVMFSKTKDVVIEHDTAVNYLEYYLLGYTDYDILDHINSFEDIHEFYNFNEKPPSMR